MTVCRSDRPNSQNTLVSSTKQTLSLPQHSFANYGMKTANNPICLAHILGSSAELTYIIAIL